MDNFILKHRSKMCCFFFLIPNSAYCSEFSLHSWQWCVFERINLLCIMILMYLILFPSEPLCTYDTKI